MVKLTAIGVVTCVAALGACAGTQDSPPVEPAGSAWIAPPPWEIASSGPPRASRGSPPVLAAPGIVGCFRDQGDPHGTSGRDLDGLIVESPSMTIEGCKRMCSDEGFPYAGTQYSTFCFCGTSYGRSGPAGNCDMRCAGNRNQTCGGKWANSVYRVR